MKFFKQCLPVEEVLSSFKPKWVECVRWSNRNLRRTDHINLFLQKGYKCDVCGVEVTHFKISKPNKDDTIGLHPFCSNGVRMTKDHIEPKCYGGKNNKDNLIPMCGPCNSIWKSKFDQHLKSTIIELTEVIE